MSGRCRDEERKPSTCPWTIPMMTTRRGAFAPSAAVVWLAVVRLAVIRQNIDETSNDNKNFLMVGASILDTKPCVDRLGCACSPKRHRSGGSGQHGDASRGETLLSCYPARWN